MPHGVPVLPARVGRSVCSSERRRPELNRLVRAFMVRDRSGQEVALYRSDSQRPHMHGLVEIIQRRL